MEPALEECRPLFFVSRCNTFFNPLKVNPVGSLEEPFHFSKTCSALFLRKKSHNASAIALMYPFYQAGSKGQNHPVKLLSHPTDIHIVCGTSMYIIVIASIIHFATDLGNEDYGTCKALCMGSLGWRTIAADQDWPPKMPDLKSCRKPEFPQQLGRKSQMPS